MNDAGSQPVRILIGSTGRRNYLIEWFRDAFFALGIDGQVCVTENDPSSASIGAADLSRIVPAYTDSGYHKSMLSVVEELKPRLFFSLNDYELEIMSLGLADEIEKLGCVVLSPGRVAQSIAADKLAMASALTDAKIATPETVTASDLAGVRRIIKYSSRLVVKHRFGSGSSGLHIVEPADLNGAIESAIRSTPENQLSWSGVNDRYDLVVVQPALVGNEYGVDFVFPLDDSSAYCAGILARKKIRMRSGETDKAVTVSSIPFGHLADGLQKVFSPKGLIDVDVMANDRGELHVIDVNLRFGGGYPFSHLAGANIPAFYLSGILGTELDPGWLQNEVGIQSAKYESVRRTHNSE